MAADRELSNEVDLRAQALVDSLQSGAGWRKEHGRMSRMTIIREGESELETDKRAYERAAEILEERGYAARFHCRPHGDGPDPTGYVELEICIGR